MVELCTIGSERTQTMVLFIKEANMIIDMMILVHVPGGRLELSMVLYIVLGFFPLNYPQLNNDGHGSIYTRYNHIYTI